MFLAGLEVDSMIDWDEVSRAESDDALKKQSFGCFRKIFVWIMSGGNLSFLRKSF